MVHPLQPSVMPAISAFTAHLLAFSFALSYVGSLYISKNARVGFSGKAKVEQGRVPRDEQPYARSRDNPDVIRARLLAVTSSTLFSCITVFLLLRRFEATTFDALHTTIRRLGFFLTTIYPHLITPILFLGPLYASLLDERLPFQRRWLLGVNSTASLLSLQRLRNYVVAPLTEEIVFRSCVLCVYHLARVSRTRMIFSCPLLFGLAHVHHAWETFSRYGRTKSAAKHAIIASTFQFTYTTLFGFHESYLFLSTGSILPPLTAHIFCNIMGVPELSAELRKFPRRKKAIVAIYILGIVGFVYTLPRWIVTRNHIYK